MTTLNVAYDAVGTSTVAKTGSTIALGPTTLTTALNPDDGTFTGSLPIPQTSTSFKALGLLPVTGNVDFLPVGVAHRRAQVAGDDADRVRDSPST